MGTWGAQLWKRALILAPVVLLLASITAQETAKRPHSESSTNPLQGESLEQAAQSIPGPPQTLKAERLPDGTVKLTWHPYGPDVLYHVFRAVGETPPALTTPMQLLGSTTEAGYVDKPSSSNTIHYAVTAFNTWGKESRRSAPATVHIHPKTKNNKP